MICSARAIPGENKRGARRAAPRREPMSSELRPAAVAGSFYSADPERLTAEIDGLLAGAHSAPSGLPPRPPKALIVPHAGYRYSGPVAASAFASLAPFAGGIRRVVLFGPSHRVHVAGMALPEATAFETPLGVVPVDHLDGGGEAPLLPCSAAAHAREHSLEVELPFLQRVLPRWSLVPIVVGDSAGSQVADAMEALWGGPETLIVVSSDLSHYLPYERARRVDEGTALQIVGADAAPLRHDQACGATPVNGLLIQARRRRLQVTRLDLRSSGDTAGPRDEVVGYGAFAFHEEAADVD